MYGYLSRCCHTSRLLRHWPNLLHRMVVLDDLDCLSRNPRSGGALHWISLIGRLSIAGFPISFPSTRSRQIASHRSIHSQGILLHWHELIEVYRCCGHVWMVGCTWNSSSLHVVLFLVWSNPCIHHDLWGSMHSAPQWKVAQVEIPQLLVQQVHRARDDFSHLDQGDWLRCHSPRIVLLLHDHQYRTWRLVGCRSFWSLPLSQWILFFSIASPVAWYFFGSLSFLPLVAVLDLSEEDGDFDFSSMISLMRNNVSLMFSSSGMEHSSMSCIPPQIKQYWTVDASAINFSNWFTDVSYLSSALLRLRGLAPHVLFILVDFNVITSSICLSRSLFHSRAPRRRRRGLLFRLINFIHLFIAWWDLDHLRMIVVVCCREYRHSGDFLLHQQVKDSRLSQNCRHHVIFDQWYVCLPGAIPLRVDGVSRAAWTAIEPEWLFQSSEATVKVCPPSTEHRRKLYAKVKHPKPKFENVADVFSCRRWREHWFDLFFGQYCLHVIMVRNVSTIPKQSVKPSNLVGATSTCLRSCFTLHSKLGQ